MSDNIMGVLIKRENLDTKIRIEGRQHEDTGRRWLSACQRERPRTDSPSEPSEGANPADTLILDFWPPDLGANIFLLFKPPGLWYFVTAAPEKSYGT